MSDGQPTSKDLLPCPFCGSPGSVYTNGGVWFGCCSECDADGQWHETEEQARAAWNRRYSPPEPCGGLVTDCIFDGPAPAGYESWSAWFAAPVKKDVYLRAVTTRPSQPPGEVPSYQAIADQLPAILANGTTQCPLCGKTYPHEHTPDEIVIYRNGVKYGRSLQGTPPEPAPQSIVCRTNDIDETGSGPTKFASPE